MVEVGFEEPIYTAVESEQMAQVCVRVMSGSLLREITVTLSSSDGQAICESSVASTCDSTPFLCACIMEIRHQWIICSV